MKGEREWRTEASDVGRVSDRPAAAAVSLQLSVSPAHDDDDDDESGI